MRKFWKILAALAGLTYLFTGQASALVVVSPGNPALVQFDTSGQGFMNNVNFFDYSCLIDCPTENANWLAAGASFQMNFGTAPFSNDLGTSTFTNPFGATNNASDNLVPAIPVGASLSDIYVTILYVDDSFGLDLFSIAVDESTLIGEFVNVVPTPVPLPGALPLFLAALAGLGFFQWRRGFRRTA